MAAIKRHASEAGESVTAYVLRSLELRMDQGEPVVPEPEWRPGTVSVPRETTRKIKEHLNPVSPPTADYLAAKEAVRDTCDHGAWNGWNTLCPTCNRRMRD